MTDRNIAMCSGVSELVLRFATNVLVLLLSFCGDRFGWCFFIAHCMPGIIKSLNMLFSLVVVNGSDIWSLRAVVTKLVKKLYWVRAKFSGLFNLLPLELCWFYICGYKNISVNKWRMPSNIDNIFPNNKCMRFLSIFCCFACRGSCIKITAGGIGGRGVHKIISSNDPTYLQYITCGPPTILDRVITVRCTITGITMHTHRLDKGL